MKITDVMNKEPRTITPDVDFATVIAQLVAPRARRLYVVDETRRILGVVTFFDILKIMIPGYVDSNLAKALESGDELILHRFKDNCGKKARDLMTRKVEALPMTSTVFEAEVLIREKRINAIPVVDAKGALVGEVSRKDVLRYIAAKTCPV